VWNMQQVFMDRQYDIKIHEPRRILDLGAMSDIHRIFCESFWRQYHSASRLVQILTLSLLTRRHGLSAVYRLQCGANALDTLADCSYGLGFIFQAGQYWPASGEGSRIHNQS
jgi:hypothetical protein